MSGDNSGILLFSGLSLLALLYSKSRMRKKNIYLNEIIDYEGFCHCQSIKFKARAPRHLVVIRCNCSICNIKKNDGFIVSKEDFFLLSGDDSLTHYKFNTGVACHMFCKKCGVQPFYQPRYYFIVTIMYN
jgi:hypothetical protein